MSPIYHILPSADILLRFHKSEGWLIIVKDGREAIVARLVSQWTKRHPIGTKLQQEVEVDIDSFPSDEFSHNQDEIAPGGGGQGYRN